MVIRVKRNTFCSSGVMQLCLQCILFSNCLNYCLRVWQTKLFDNSTISNSIYIHSTIFVLFLIGVLPKICNGMKKDIIFVFLILVTLYLISYWKNGFETICFDNTLIWTFGSNFVSYIVVRYIDNWKTMLEMYTGLSRIILIIIIFSWFQTKDVVNYRSTADWYMFFSSALLMPIIGVFILFEKKKKLVDLLLVIIGIVLVFMNGSRGTLVQIAVFLLLYYTMNGKYLEGIGRLLTVMVMLFAFFQYVAKYVDISSSRTLLLLFSNAIGETDRIVAWRRMLEYFFSQSISIKLFGLGLAGDKTYIYQNIYRAGYPHNILIEQLMQLGIIGFVIIFLVVMVITIKMFFSALKEIRKYLWQYLLGCIYIVVVYVLISEWIENMYVIMALTILLSTVGYFLILYYFRNPYLFNFLKMRKDKIRRRE